MLRILDRARGWLAGAPRREAFRGSASYWQDRYVSGRDSGSGSYNRLAAFKAEVLNAYVRENGIGSVVELGCGDGAQLSLARYPSYVGIDVAPRALEICAERYAGDPTKRFLPEVPDGETFDMSMSLDVIYHLVEDDVFDSYMRRLFAISHGRVAIYSSDADGIWPDPHVRHRSFSSWVAANCPGWSLERRVPNRHPYDPADPSNTSFADFAFYRRA